MERIRVIPVLLIHNRGVVKSERFGKFNYVGDPINAVKIFNEKEVDEIIILDIDATKQGRGPDLDQVREIAGEAFIPMAYGGGISSVQQVEELFYAGIEKIVVNSSAFFKPPLIEQIARLVGSQSVVVSIDVKKTLFGKYKVFVKSGGVNTGIDPIVYAKKMQDLGAGEIFLNSVDRDGTYSGYDVELINSVSSQISIPLIACGGASGFADLAAGVKAGASAVAAGSMFVFQRPHKAVLISYPSQSELIQHVYPK